MKKPIVSIVAAIDENRALGKNNTLLWHIQEDMKRFKELTRDHPIIMGRTTFQSIGRPLPKRTNIVITRDKNFSAEGLIVVHSLEEAIEQAKATGTEEVFVIGGGQIYAQAMSMTDKLYLTVVKGTFDADTFFPTYDEFKTVLFKEECEGDGYTYTFLELTR